MIVINPGSGPVHGSSKEDADKNMQKFLEDRGMIEDLAREVWTLLSKQSEVKYVHRNDPDPYKPFYRISTILASSMWGPPHFKKWGVARHLTDEEVVAVVRLAHPYLAERLSDEGGEAQLLRIFHDTAELYEPERWAP